jgi:hypothetical protein
LRYLYSSIWLKIFSQNHLNISLQFPNYFSKIKYKLSINLETKNKNSEKLFKIYKENGKFDKWIEVFNSNKSKYCNFVVKCLVEETNSIFYGFIKKINFSELDLSIEIQKIRLFSEEDTNTLVMIKPTNENYTLPAQSIQNFYAITFYYGNIWGIPFFDKN